VCCCRTVPCLYTDGSVFCSHIHSGAKRTIFFFSNNCNFFFFQYKKNYVNTKQPVINAVLITYIDYRKLYRKDGVLLSVHMSGASPQSSASHLLTFLVAQLQFLHEWKLSDRQLYEVFERRLLIATSQEIPRISQNPKVHYRTHKHPPPFSILGQPNPVHIPTSHLLQIHPNIIHPSMPRSP